LPDIAEKQKGGKQIISEEQKRDMEQYISTNDLMELLVISRSTVCRLNDAVRELNTFRRKLLGRIYAGLAGVEQA
jgi:hypothetical protein